MNDTPHRAETEINGRRYGMILPSPRTGLQFAPRVAKLLGGAISGVGNLENLNDNSAALGAIGGALGKLDADEVTRLLDDTFSQIQIFTPDGEKLTSKAVFDRHFMAHRGDMLQVGIWALWTGCKDFFFDDAENFLGSLNDLRASLSQTDGKQNTDSDD